MRLAQRMIGGAFLAIGGVIALSSGAPVNLHPWFCFGLGVTLFTLGGILANEGCKDDD